MNLVARCQGNSCKLAVLMSAKDTLCIDRSRGLPHAADKLWPQFDTGYQSPATGHKPLSSSVACRLLSNAFRGWRQAADKLCQQTLADGYEEVVGQVGSMKAENDRLRRDNERFVRLIDSGEWGRGRVAELTQAGECPIAAVCLSSFAFDLLCVNQTSAQTGWLDTVLVYIKALHRMAGLVHKMAELMLSSTCVHRIFAHNGWVGVVWHIWQSKLCTQWMHLYCSA